jgi:hypothetical protein
MAPSLALSYSSQAPLRGDVAAGWTLGLPTIEARANPNGTFRYRSDLAGGARLVATLPWVHT